MHELLTVFLKDRNFHRKTFRIKFQYFLSFFYFNWASQFWWGIPLHLLLGPTLWPYEFPLEIGLCVMSWAGKQPLTIPVTLAWQKEGWDYPCQELQSSDQGERREIIPLPLEPKENTYLNCSLSGIVTGLLKNSIITDLYCGQGGNSLMTKANHLMTL